MTRLIAGAAVAAVLVAAAAAYAVWRGGDAPPERPQAVAVDGPAAPSRTALVATADADEGAPLPDMVLGDPDAPIEIIEYASMTCPHCAAFHMQTLPRLVSHYIEPGRAKLVFREFPLDRVALEVAAVARCAEPEHFFGFIDVLLETQSSWARAEDAMAEVKRILRMGGLDPALVDRCRSDEATIDAIIATRIQGTETYGVRSTPSLVINGELHSGGHSYEDLDAVLRALEGDG